MRPSAAVPAPPKDAPVSCGHTLGGQAWRRHALGLAARRRAAGYSQDALAEHLGIERSTVVRWERGTTAPQPWHRPRLAGALKLSLDDLDELLGEVPSPTPGQGRQGSETCDVNRRKVMGLLALAGLYVGARPIDPQRLDYAAAHPGRIDSATIGDYAELNRHLWRVFVLSKSKATTFPLVRQQLEVLTNAVQHSPGAGFHAKLCALIGDLAQLAGEILFDGNRYTDASHCYAVAASASKEAGERDLWACAITRHAFIGLYEHEFKQTVPLLDLAASIARHGDTALSTRHWVNAVQAQALAGLGDLRGCQAALDHAMTVRQLTAPSHNGGWLRFDGSRLDEEHGACYTTLKRLDLAERALTDALRRNLSSRRHGSVLVDLAAICAERRDIDQLLSHATTALDLARRTGSGVVTRKLQLLQPSLLPLTADHRINQLGQEIRELAHAY